MAETLKFQKTTFLDRHPALARVIAKLPFGNPLADPESKQLRADFRQENPNFDKFISYLGQNPRAITYIVTLFHDKNERIRRYSADFLVRAMSEHPELSARIITCAASALKTRNPEALSRAIKVLFRAKMLGLDVSESLSGLEKLYKISSDPDCCWDLKQQLTRISAVLAYTHCETYDTKKLSELINSHNGAVSAGAAYGITAYNLSQGNKAAVLTLIGAYPDAGSYFVKEGVKNALTSDGDIKISPEIREYELRELYYQASKF